MGLRASVAVFVVSLILSLVIWAPVSVIASIAERQLGMPVPLQQAQGTIWQGKGAVSVNQVALDAEWQYQFPLSWQLTVGNTESGELVGSLAPLSTQLNNLTGAVKAGWLLNQIEPYLGGIYLDAPGEIDLAGVSAHINNGQLTFAEGTISYDGGLATYNLFSDVNVNVPPMIALIEASDDRRINARLLTQDGLLLGDAEVAEGLAQYKVYNALPSLFGMGSGNPADIYIENQIAMPALGM